MVPVCERIQAGDEPIQCICTIQQKTGTIIVRSSEKRSPGPGTSARRGLLAGGEIDGLTMQIEAHGFAANQFLAGTVDNSDFDVVRAAVHIVEGGFSGWYRLSLDLTVDVSDRSTPSSR